MNGFKVMIINYWWYSFFWIIDYLLLTVWQSIILMSHSMKLFWSLIYFFFSISAICWSKFNYFFLVLSLLNNLGPCTTNPILSKVSWICFFLCSLASLLATFSRSFFWSGLSLFRRSLSISSNLKSNGTSFS